MEPARPHASPTETELCEAGIVELILKHASRAPGAPALLFSNGKAARVVSFSRLVGRAAGYAARLRAEGVQPGARVLVLMRPDEDLYSLVLAILGSGMTLIVVDGRAGARRLIGLLDDAGPDIVIASQALMRWWPLIPVLRRARRFTVGGSVPGAKRIAPMPNKSPAWLQADASSRSAASVVSFSSGNTGRAKAVVRTHDVLIAQHHAIAAAVPLDRTEVNLPGFPLATLHNLCCGVTSVIPSADLRSMVDADPAAVVALIERFGVTSLSGAPAYIGRLARCVISRGTPLRAIRRLTVGGGPVGRALCADIRRAFPAAEAHVLYGATECEPIASVSIDEVAVARGEGFLVGRPAEGTDVCLRAASGSGATMGEVVVRGPQVSSAETWHRTGDLARFDVSGRLWLLGRIGTEISHHDCTLHPYVIEAEALALGAVRAAALVARGGAPTGELVVEPAKGIDERAMVTEVRKVLDRLGLPFLPVRTIDEIPMDVRHGSKVARPELIRRLEREER